MDILTPVQTLEYRREILQDEIVYQQEQIELHSLQVQKSSKRIEDLKLECNALAFAIAKLTVG